MKNLFLNNGLFFAFVVPQLLVLLFANTNVEEIRNIDYSNAIIFHISSILLFIVGYIFTSLIYYRRFKKQIVTVEYRSSLKIVCYSIIVIGLVTSVLTIFFFVGITDYFKMLLSGNTEILEIRTSSATGGVSGLIKMFNYAPLAVFISISSILLFSSQSLSYESELKKIQKVALIASIIKVFFILDRLTILAIFVVIFFYAIKNRISKLKLLLYFLIGIIFLGLMTSIRQGDSIIDFLSLYSKLSITNFQLLMNSSSPSTFNGANTFLHPLNFILDFFNLPVLKTYKIELYEWNPAQYFMSYLFQDFEYFSLFFYPFFGFQCKIIEINKSRGNLFFVAVYLFLFFILITFITVPFIRAMECWLAFIIIYVISRLFNKNHHGRQRKCMELERKVQS